MGLKAASTVAITLLFGLMYAVVFVIGVWFLPAGTIGLIIMIALTLLIVFFQWAISPVIIGWIYKIHWFSYDDFSHEFPHLAEVVNKVVELRGIKRPRMGVIHDLNPNAFTYGHTKNNARIVITDGILKHLNKKEQEAVVGHELGHVVHSDFILMTIVFAIPLVLLTIARWAYYTAWFSGRGRSSDDEGGYIYLLLLAIAVLSYVAYYLGFLISLVISRIREYYADQHAAEVTQDPNALSTGLVKIAYGLVASGGAADIKERNKSKVRAVRGLGIFDPKAAKAFSVAGIGGGGGFSKESIQAAAAWDLYNPWAKYYQLFSTHPLAAKRIMRLNDQCEIYGIKPEIDFSKAKKIKEEQAGKSMMDEFIYDLIIKALPTLVFISLIAITILWIFSLFGLIIATFAVEMLILIWAFGFILIGLAHIIRTGYMYKKGFERNKIVDLVTNIKVSPIRNIPTVVEGKIIGRGIPGYYFSEDLYFQDDTGLMYIDYHYGLGIVDFFFGILGAKKLVGQRVRIKGWYRRGPGPYIQVHTIETESGRRIRNHAKGLTYFWAILAFIVAAILFYVWFSISPQL